LRGLDVPGRESWFWEQEFCFFDGWLVVHVSSTVQQGSNLRTERKIKPGENANLHYDALPMTVCLLCLFALCQFA